MKTAITFVLLLFIMLPGRGQQVSVDRLLISITPPFFSEQDTLYFPYVRTGNAKIDTMIMVDMVNRFTSSNIQQLPADSVLREWANGSIVYLDYKVTYLKNNIISLQLSAEGCGAYCTQWTDYFTYSLKTGHLLAIHDLVKVKGRFEYLVIRENNNQYEKERKALKIRLEEEEQGFDKDLYESVMADYDDCVKRFQISDFALYEDRLEIISDCPLPNVIKSLSPVIELKYPYKKIRKYLKKKL